MICDPSSSNDLLDVGVSAGLADVTLVDNDLLDKGVSAGLADITLVDKGVFEFDAELLADVTLVGVIAGKALLLPRGAACPPF